MVIRPIFGGISEVTWQLDDATALHRSLRSESRITGDIYVTDNGLLGCVDQAFS